jgi:hypothetical protein
MRHAAVAANIVQTRQLELKRQLVILANIRDSGFDSIRFDSAVEKH